MWIENVAAADIPQAFHHDAGPNSMLISIVDPAGWPPTPKYPFKEVHRFEFLDAEDEDGFPEEAKISRKQRSPNRTSRACRQSTSTRSTSSKV